jgi:hypothetical protein
MRIFKNLIKKQNRTDYNTLEPGGGEVYDDLSG